MSVRRTGDRRFEPLKTERLILRRWRPSDRAPFAAINADPQVMEYFPSRLTPEQSDESIARIEAHFDRHEFGFWAVEIPHVTPLAGFIGLSVPRFEAHFTPCVEIGWRLGRQYWGRGYATEGARAALAWGFERLQLSEIVSFTVPHNWRSRRVMENIGMTRDPNDDFRHPALADTHPLSYHVLYRCDRSAFARSRFSNTDQ
ncbi:GNAT family N-acetyltransferase [Geitlerinema sp. CS-897]|nr:GNAT family N-acetyltransferase [Geitlerinema sp. CS-897]